MGLVAINFGRLGRTGVLGLAGGRRTGEELRGSTGSSDGRTNDEG